MTERLQHSSPVVQLWIFHLLSFPVGEPHSRGVVKTPCQASQTYREAIQHFQMVCRAAFCPMCTSIHSSENQLAKKAIVNVALHKKKKKKQSQMRDPSASPCCFRAYGVTTLWSDCSTTLPPPPSLHLPVSAGSGRRASATGTLKHIQEQGKI